MGSLSDANLGSRIAWTAFDGKEFDGVLEDYGHHGDFTIVKLEQPENEQPLRYNARSELPVEVS